MFLAYISGNGRLLIDRELYLPKEWTNSQEDRLAAKVPDSVCFATKPELAWQMIERAVKAGVSFGCFTADEVYGNNHRLRVWLEQQKIWHVTALACKQHIWLPAIAPRDDAYMTGPDCGCLAGRHRMSAGCCWAVA